MLYLIYQAAETGTPAIQTVPARVAGMHAANDRQGAPETGLLSFAGRTMLVALVIGILVSSLLVMEA